MKNFIKFIAVLLVALSLVLCFAACNTETNSEPVSEGNEEGIWANATHKEDKEFGQGAKTVTVKVKVEDHTVTFTIKTDKNTVGAALIEHELISGDNSEYGLYIKRVNGILADYDTDQSYWAFYANGEYSMSGVDTTEIEENTVYTLEYTK